MKKPRHITIFMTLIALAIATALYSFIPVEKDINVVALEKAVRHNDIGPDCTFNGFKLYGKIKFVESFPDVKVQIVNSFPDIKVKIVESFPDDCGEWKIVESFPDTKVQIVNSFPDVKVQYVESFPGLN